MSIKNKFQNKLISFFAAGIVASVVLVFLALPADASDGLYDAISDAIGEHEGNRHTSNLTIGGWSDFLYQDRNTDGYKQILDPHHLYLFFDATLDDNWRSYFEIEIEHLPDLKGSPATKAGEATKGSGEGEIKVERMYIEYYHSDEVNMRVGKFNTPLGIWTPEHWAVNVPSVQKPIHEDNKYVPNKQVGLEGYGNWVPASSDSSPEVNYAVWVSTGEDLFGTNKPTDSKLAYGADANATFSERVKIGLSAYLQHNPGKSDRQEETLFPYAEVYLPQGITFTGEYLHQSRDAGFSDIDTWYAAAKWQVLPSTYLYYRLDKGDDDKRGDGMTHTGNVMTVGYWPRPYVRTKLEFSTHDFDASSKENFNQWNAWIAVIF